MRCQKCGTENEESARLCSFCKEPLPTNGADISWVDSVDFTSGIEWHKDSLPEIAPDFQDIIDGKEPRQEPEVLPEEELEVLPDIPKEFKHLKGSLMILLTTCVVLLALLLVFVLLVPDAGNSSSDKIPNEAVSIYMRTETAATETAATETAAAEAATTEAALEDTETFAAEAGLESLETPIVQEGDNSLAADEADNSGADGPTAVYVDGIYFTLSGDEAELVQYPDAAGSVVIPAAVQGVTVTSIAAEAFADCTELKSLVIPEGVERIGERCFIRCSNLMEIVMPDSLTYIGDGAMDYMPSFTIISNAGTYAQQFAQRYKVNWMELNVQP